MNLELSLLMIATESFPPNIREKILEPLDRFKMAEDHEKWISSFTNDDFDELVLKFYAEKCKEYQK